MNNAAELEAYMNRVEERFLSIYPLSDTASGAAGCWRGYRKYIEQVRAGGFSGVTMETATLKATDFMVGLRRLLGEELHPRGKIRRRQLQALQAAAQPVPSPEEVAAFAQNLRETQNLRRIQAGAKQQDGDS